MEFHRKWFDFLHCRLEGKGLPATDSDQKGDHIILMEVPEPKTDGALYLHPSLLGRGESIKAPPIASQAPPAIHDFIKIAFSRLALETLADPRRCIDPR